MNKTPTTQQRNETMTKFSVSANGTFFGIYEANSEQAARDLCARDAGYASEEDMVRRLEQPSDLEAGEMDIQLRWEKTTNPDFSEGVFACVQYACSRLNTGEWLVIEHEND